MNLVSRCIVTKSFEFMFQSKINKVLVFLLDKKGGKVFIYFF